MAKRKRRPAPIDDNPVIGYVAALTARELWCAGETAIVASSERHLREYLDVSAAVFRLAAVRFDTLVFGLRGGVGYALDAQAYQRFYPLAHQAGLRLETEAFSLLAPAGESGAALELMRVQLAR